VEAGYFVHVAEGVEAYIRGIDALSEARRQEVLNACLQDLAQVSDDFMQRYPLEHESFTFQYKYAMIDGDLIYSFRFVADGSHMAMGINRGHLRRFRNDMSFSLRIVRKKLRHAERCGCAVL
jgi:hypothetical protein